MNKISYHLVKKVYWKVNPYNCQAQPSPGTAENSSILVFTFRPAVLPSKRTSGYLEKYNVQAHSQQDIRSSQPFLTVLLYLMFSTIVSTAFVNILFTTYVYNFCSYSYFLYNFDIQLFFKTCFFSVRGGQQNKILEFQAPHVHRCSLGM